MTKSTRNSYLDVMKFLFSIIIILYHFGFFFKGGYIVVEAFFMISGYFLMKSLKRSDDSLPLGEQTVRFVIHKYKAIVFFLIPSAIIGCIAYIFILPRDTESVIMQATLMLFEMIPLQTAGYSGFFATGVAWYLSALLISSMIVFPMAKKLKTTFSVWLAPLIAILGYGFLMTTFGNFDVPNSWILGLVNSGIIRALAGLSAGCFLYEISVRLEDKKPSACARVTLTVLEIVGWGYCVFVMNQYPRSIYDAAVVFIMFALLLIGINRYSYLTYLIQFPFTKHLATVSTIVYLNHYYWSQIIVKKFPELPTEKSLPLYFGLIAASSVAVYIVGRILTYLVSKPKKKVS